MIQEIKFSKNTYSKGRNGIVNTSGLEVIKCAGSGNVMLSPITSKGKASGACFIEIPKSSIGDIVLGMTKATNTDPLIKFHENLFQMAMMFGEWQTRNDPGDVFTGGSGQAMEDIIAWAKEFTEKNKDREWDGEWYDELEEFFDKKIKSA